jgi:hypothetical protein
MYQKETKIEARGNSIVMGESEMRGTYGDLVRVIGANVVTLPSLQDHVVMIKCLTWRRRLPPLDQQACRLLVLSCQIHGSINR